MQHRMVPLEWWIPRYKAWTVQNYITTFNSHSNYLVNNSCSSLYWRVDWSWIFRSTSYFGYPLQKRSTTHQLSPRTCQIRVRVRICQQTHRRNDFIGMLDTSMEMLASLKSPSFSFHQRNHYACSMVPASTYNGTKAHMSCGAVEKIARLIL